MKFKDRFGTATFSLKDRDSGNTYTMKLQATFINLMKFKKATGTDDPMTYMLLYGADGGVTSVVEVLYSFMIDFYDEAKPATSLIDQMDRDNVMGWLLNADEESNKGSGDKLKEALKVIMGEQYQRLLDQSEKKSKKKADSEAA